MARIMDSERRERQIKLWLLGGLLVALPLLSYPLAIAPRELVGDALTRRFDVRLPWARVGLLLCAVYLAWQIAGREGKTFVRRLPRGWTLVLALFGLAGAVSVAWAAHFCVSIGPWFETISALGLAGVAMVWGRNAGLQRLLACGVAATAVVAAYALMQLVFGTDQVVATLGNRNLLADYLIFSVPLIFCWGFATRGSGAEVAPASTKRNVGRAVAAAVLLVAVFVALASCRARAAWGALALVTAVALAWWLAMRNPQRALVVVGAFVVALAVVFVMARPRVAAAFHEDVRWEIWRGTWRLIQESPLVGHGPGTFALAYPPYRTAEYFQKPKAAFFTDHAHNEWLQVWAETGALGLAAFIAALLFAAHQWWHRRAQMQPQNWAFALAALLLLAHGTLEVSLRHPPGQTLLWLALGLSLSGLTLPVFEARIVERARLAAVAALGLGVCAALYVFVWRPVQSDLQLRGSFAAPTEGDGENAILQAEAAVAAQPCRVEALYRLAVLLERSGQHEARLGEVLLRVKKLAPDYRAVNGKAGRWLCRQGKIADGIPFLEREVALDAGIPVKQEIRAVYAEDRFWLARAYLDTGQREQACRTLQEAQRFDPENPRVKELLLKHCRGPNAASP